VEISYSQGTKYKKITDVWKSCIFLGVWYDFSLCETLLYSCLTIVRNNKKKEKKETCVKKRRIDYRLYLDSIESRFFRFYTRE